ncbi:MAG: glycoside hydrolase family 26 protein [Thermoanaerobaculales bacterium]
MRSRRDRHHTAFAVVTALSCSLTAAFVLVSGALGNSQGAVAGPRPVRPHLMEERVFYGAFVPESSLADLSGLAAFEADAGKAVSVVMWYLAWGAPGSAPEFQRDGMTAVRAHGAIPVITWAPRDASKGANQPLYRLRAIANGAFDPYIRAFAEAAKAWSHPFFLRFAHEMNGNWYPWSETVNGNAKGDYVAAWRHVHDVFTAARVTNVTWVWCPSRVGTNPYGLRELYPGDAYVDWAGMDGYNQPSARQGWQSFSGVFGDLYQRITQITSKPIMIGETSSLEQGGEKAVWITDALTLSLPDLFPQVRAVLWFNRHFTGTTDLDWRIESSPAARAAFSAAVSQPRFASNEFAALAASPIPPPER